MKYICAQPANTYYLWQVEVMINNFIRVGINPNDIEILLSYNGNIDERWLKMQKHYNTVRFFFYPDTREDRRYIPSIYFNALKQHLKAYPNLKDEVLFTHDSDTIFTHKPNFNGMIGGSTWYVSDTKAYLNYDYIQQKGNDTYLQMCKIVDIDERIPKLMNSNTGGAQYIVKNTSYEFWEKVELDACKLYEYFCEIEPHYVKKHENDYPIQKWTAGMWSYVWNAWRLGIETVIHKDLDFTWSTNVYETTEKCAILHNAGVTGDKKDLFFKGAYTNSLPYNEPLELNKGFASYYYWEEIQRTKEKSILI
jgi:hypothetical protein